MTNLKSQVLKNRFEQYSHRVDATEKLFSDCCRLSCGAFDVEELG